MGAYIKSHNPVTFDRELFKLKDDGTIALDWVDSIPGPDNKQPIVAIMPGLSSNSDEIYVLNLCIKAKEEGFKAVVINYRGSSKVPLSVLRFIPYFCFLIVTYALLCCISG